VYARGEKMSEKNVPKLIEGGISIDDRGEVSFVNDFNFANVKRFYMVSNHKQGFVRAWHGHKHESKCVFAVEGAALVGAVEIDNWEKPSKNAQVYKYVLSSKKPAVLYIPPGYANGFMSLTENAKLIFFSSGTIEEAKRDDIRYDSRYWDIWNVVER
jgi:dTDP-4-dehydrorhamnose 3,5-epimerase